MRKFLGLFLFCSCLLSLATEQEQVSEQIRLQLENIANTEISYQSDSSLAKIYTESQYAPLWHSPKTVSKALHVLYRSNEDGLNPEDYHYNEILELVKRYKTLNIFEAAQMDILITDGILLYTSHMLSGKLHPATVDAEWHVVRREGDPLELFMQTIKGDSIEALVELIRPRHSIYHGLMTALRQYSAIEKAGSWRKVPNGGELTLGMSDPRIAHVKDRLIASNDLAPETCRDDEVYDSLSYNAVQYFQLRHGITANGVIGKSTIDAMNVPVEDRLHQLRVNLERWRWLPQKFGDYYIKVNIASFELKVVRNGVVEREHKIIAGRPTRSTPIFNSTMKYLVFNPTWTVPPGILKADILPAQRKNPNYLGNKGIQILDKSGHVVDPSGVNWHAGSVYQYTYRQAPGKSNALGAVKFMFDNPYHVYLHDTPSRELFESEERALSSGCIRVQSPLELAEYLLKDQKGFDVAGIPSVIQSNKTKTIFLAETPEVYLLYWTAWTDEQGNVHFRKDFYDRDTRVMEGLSAKYSLDVR